MVQCTATCVIVRTPQILNQLCALAMQSQPSNPSDSTSSVSGGLSLQAFDLDPLTCVQRPDAASLLQFDKSNLREVWSTPFAGRLGAHRTR